MKKTLTVNLGGTVYHIDDDAYRLLDDYLANLKHFFRKQEGAEEIVNDIEIRIAELFAEKVSAGKQVITIADVEEIIALLSKSHTGCRYQRLPDSRPVPTRNYSLSSNGS